MKDLDTAGKFGVPENALGVSVQVRRAAAFCRAKKTGRKSCDLRPEFSSLSGA
jgi:hypothetical protein